MSDWKFSPVIVRAEADMSTRSQGEQEVPGLSPVQSSPAGPTPGKTKPRRSAVMNSGAPPETVVQKAALALACLEPTVGLVDHIDPSLAPDYATIAMAFFQGLQRIGDFHRSCLLLEPRRVPKQLRYGHEVPENLRARNIVGPEAYVNC